jgi:undecaprenyl-diphosphatase
LELLKAIILGIIQGLTEFLPVSSSGHLEIAKAILGENYSSEESLMMTVILHAATALSTIIVFRKDIVEIFKGLFAFKRNEETEFSIKIILSMIPAAIIGLKYDDILDKLFDGQILLVGFMLLVTGVLLFFADRAKSTNKEVSWGNALIIGISQAIAMLPGISRSGATISTSVLLGVDRTKAARFSFLMVVPLILGKVAKDVLSGDLSMDSMSALPMLAGFMAALITGWVACKWMIKLVQKSSLKGFAYYCFAIGLIAITYTFAVAH